MHVWAVNAPCVFVLWMHRVCLRCQCDMRVCSVDVTRVFVPWMHCVCLRCQCEMPVCFVDVTSMFWAVVATSMFELWIQHACFVL